MDVVKKSNKVIAVCLAGVNSDYQHTTLNKISEIAKVYNYKILVFMSFSDLYYNVKHDIGQANIYNLINFDYIDGLIIIPDTIKDKAIFMNIIDNAKKACIPVVSIDTYVEGCYNILFDYQNSMEKIVRHFTDYHKFTKINFIAGIKNNEYSEERLGIYKKVLEKKNITFDERRVGYGDFLDEPTYRVIDEFMNSGLEMPEVIICANDAMAIAACQKLTEHGYKIPDDICVSGFDGIIEEKYHVPRLTTARQSNNLAGEKAVLKLKDIFEGIDTEMLEYIFHDIVFSESCGCEKQKEQNSNSFIREMYDQIKDIQENDVRLIRMVSNLSDAMSIEEAIPKFCEYMRTIFSSKAWLCLVDNYIGNVEALDEIIDENSGFKAGYSDKMRLLIYKNRNNFSSDMIFETKEMIPQFYEQIEEFDEFIFSPLHFQDLTLGYMVVTIENPVYEWQGYYSFLMNISNVLQTIKRHTELKMIINKLEDMYVRDPMTGLYNRRGFYKNINQVINQCLHTFQSIVIISIDLDGLKYINDKFGHAEGDNAIKIVANALLSTAVNDEICARFGGDEYIVAGFCDSIDYEYTNDFLTRFNEYLDSYNRFSGKPYEVAASYGVSKQSQFENIPIDELIKAADTSMYETKQKHRKSDDYKGQR